MKYKETIPDERFYSYGAVNLGNDFKRGNEKQEENKIACGPEYGSKRISRGGSWSPYTVFDYTGDRYSFDPNECYNYMGFRVVQSR